MYLLQNTTMTSTEILQKLVSFPVLGGMSNLSILEWIKDYLKQHDIDFTLVPNKEQTKASLHCRIGPAVDGGVILSGHMDVVPVEGQDWETDPFLLIEQGDRLYARGSCDMKGFIACCLAALPKIKSASLKRPIYFAFSYDEEIGCLAAPELAQNIKNTYSEKPRYAIIGEPSMMQTVIGQKGIMTCKTVVNGSAGHSSRIKQEVSAIHEAARLIIWLEDYMDNLIDRGDIDSRFTPPHTSIHCGLIEQSGIAPNVIADSCTFLWDVRVIPKNNANTILQNFEAHCREVENRLRPRFTGFKISNEIHHPAVPPLDTNETDDIVSIVNSLTGSSNTQTVSYAAEAGQFSEAGFKAVICGPGDIAQAHRANEFVAKEQLKKCDKFMEQLISWCSS